MWLIRHRKITYAISGTLVMLSVVFVSLWGLKLGIDFTGGSLLEGSYVGGRPSIEVLRVRLTEAGIADAAVQPTGESGVLIRSGHLTEAQHQNMLLHLNISASQFFREKSFDTIGPTIGKELARDSVIAIILVIILIVAYIAFAFRKVSEPVASWKYGVATVIALVHDVAIPVGFFAILGHFLGYEVDTLFVTALLTILGFSVHDTIVVFDRIRENLKNLKSQTPFEAVVGQSISQTLTRSINTSFTVLLVLLAIYFFGGQSTRHFSLALIVGIIFGTYSSIGLASPLLVTWNSWSRKKS